jgi:hypothetical protein
LNKPTNPATPKTIDDEALEVAEKFITAAKDEGKPFFVWFNTTHMHFRTHCKVGAPGGDGLAPARLGHWSGWRIEGAATMGDGTPVTWVRCLAGAQEGGSQGCLERGCLG